MSHYIMTPIEYAEKLFKEGNYKKAGAYLQYQVDMFREKQRTFSEYSRMWETSKSTTHKWVSHFKTAIKMHHNFWSDANEKQVKNDDSGCERSANGKTNTESTSGTSFQGGGANGKTNEGANGHTIYINNKIINKGVFEDFIAHRKAIKSPMTQRAVDLFVNKVEKLHEEGYDTTALIETAIMNGWKTVYPNRDYLKKKTSSYLPEGYTT